MNIKLEWNDKSLEFWSGRQFGMEVYENQVKDKINPSDFEDMLTIEFPESIKFLNWSFVQGFFADILHQIGGKEHFTEHIRVISADPQKTEKIEKMVLEKLKIPEL